MLDVLDVIAGLALALVVVSLALAWATRTAVRLMCNLRDEETEHAHTRRRLADVEAIRRRDAVADAHDDGGACTDCGTTGWGSDHDEDCRNHPGRRFDPEEVSELPAAIKRPAHGGYPGAVPRGKASLKIVPPHHRSAKGGHAAYVSEDAGGCALPIVVTESREQVGEVVELGKPIQPLYGERAIDRAYADAGMMPVADYVAKHGREPHQ